MPDRSDLLARFAALAAPTPDDEVEWRPQTAPRPGTKTLYLGYITAEFVRERLDAHFPGDWHLAVTKLGEGADENGVVEIVYKGSLTVGGITRESIGSDKTDKAADSDCLKRAAHRFGVGSDLRKYARNYVPYGVDPAENFKRITLGPVSPPSRTEDPYEAAGATPPPMSPPPPKALYRTAPCPDCGAKVYDNRLTRKANQPLEKCSNRDCPGNGGRGYVVWPPRTPARTTSSAAARSAVEAGFPEPLVDEDDDLPF